MDIPQSSEGSDAAIVAADDFDDEGYGESTNSSYVTSIASDILHGVEENGRTYASYGKHMYGIPIDEHEQQRNVLQHAKFFLLLDGRLHLAPIQTPQKILDIGTGSGIWAMDMADKYPGAQVLGIDIAAVQPRWVPPNCLFEIEDAEDEWTFSEK
jgi:2-polyprenyl-3-methyl-5-hydroxy-6-metoxy-1,4-benzoquinol methylase